jgi:hypothetical protein
MAVWFGKVLERVPYKGSMGTLVKVGMDQGFAAPNMLALFFTATTLMEGKNFEDVKKKLNSVSIYSSSISLNSS